MKRMVKRITDVCMTVLLLCLMANPVTGERLHEWIGMTAVLILHHILNIDHPKRYPELHFLSQFVCVL